MSAVESSSFAICESCHQINRVSLDRAEKSRPVCGKCSHELRFERGVSVVSGTTLTQLIAHSPVPVVVDVWAPWCGPCRAFAPVFFQVAREQAGRAVFAKLNADEYPMAADVYHVRSVPTLIVFRNGLEQHRQSGAVPAEIFRAWLDKLLGMQGQAA